jgi:hypothetical protein
LCRGYIKGEEIGKGGKGEEKEQRKEKRREEGKLSI